MTNDGSFNTFTLIMRKFLLGLGLLISVSSYAQQTFVNCKDSLRTPNDYEACGNIYDPVCGCDQVTYRNACAAFFWGGLYSNSWTTNTVCGNFDIDFYPTAVSYFPAHFNLFMKTPGSAVLYIYDSFGRLQYSQYFLATYAGQILSDEIPVQNLFLGIYSAVVVVGGDVQYKKFAKVTNFK